MRSISTLFVILLLTHALHATPDCTNDYLIETDARDAFYKDYIKFNCESISKPDFQAIFGEFQRSLAEGSYGRVDWYLKGRQNYAIKKMFRIDDPRGLFNELNTSGCIQKNMPQEYLKYYGVILGCYFVSGAYRLAMNYYPVDLEDYMAEHIQKQYYDQSTAQKKLIEGFVTQLAIGIYQLHRLGIDHKDLKPANIMIAEDGTTPVYVDFGLSVVENDPENKPYGTPDFVDPDLKNRHKGGPKNDIYSLGIVFYMLFRGEYGQNKYYKIFDEADFTKNKKFYPNTTNLTFPPKYTQLLFMLSTNQEDRLDSDTVLRLVKNFSTKKPNNETECSITYDRPAYMETIIEKSNAASANFMNLDFNINIDLGPSVEVVSQDNKLDHSVNIEGMKNKKDLNSELIDVIKATLQIDQPAISRTKTGKTEMFKPQIKPLGMIRANTKAFFLL